MRKLVFIFISLVVGSIALVGCSSINCPLNNTVYTQYDLKKSTATADTLRDTLTVWISRDSNTDTVLLNRQLNATTLQLPISYTGDEDVLFFRRCAAGGSPVIDEVRIKKTNTPHFESVECSPNYFHEITSVETTNNGIDSIVVKNKTVDYNARTNFYIYFKH